jgi:hypothetical protein
MPARLLAPLMLVLSTLSACDGGTDGEADEGTSEPTLEELISECEDVAECAACPSERQAIEDQPIFPVYDQSCLKVCSDQCDVAGSECNMVCASECAECISMPAECNAVACVDDCQMVWISECEVECEVERDELEAAWQAQSDANFDALRECEDGCYTAPPGDPACGVEGDEVLWCPILYGIDVAAGAEFTCESRLTEIFG